MFDELSAAPPGIDAMNEDSPRDSLSELAPLLRVRPELQDYCRFGGLWSAHHDHATPRSAHFHIVAKGRCLLDRPGFDAIELGPGDVMLLPQGSEHVVRAPGAGRHPSSFVVEFENSIRRKSTNNDVVETELICGQLHFEAAGQSLISAILPEVIVLRAEGFHRLQHLQPLVFAIRDELDAGRMGSSAIATDLASALFVMMLRRYLDDITATENGLVNLLADRATSRAVQAMIRDPARPWTLDELAALAATSRATLVRAFRRSAHASPLAFLSELRLSQVNQRLRTTRDALAKIAVDVGFQSEATMSRAYFRRYGVRPGVARRLGSEGPQDAADTSETS